MGLLTKILGDPHEKYVVKLRPVVEKINALESEFERLSDEDLRGTTTEFRQRVGSDDVLPEAFAAVREAAKRTLGQRHFDVQMLGAIVLHRGAISEMRTGEGKTLVATLPAYLNALSGKGCLLYTSPSPRD